MTSSPLPAGPRLDAPLWFAQFLYRPFDALERARARYGEPFSMPLPGRGIAVVFSEPDAVKEVFSAPPEAAYAGAFNDVLRPFLGPHSLLMLDGDEHLRQRRLLMPPFHGERMAAYGRAMIDATHEAIDAWPLGRAFPVQRTTRVITMRVILRTIFGLDEGPRAQRIMELLGSIIDAASQPYLLLPAAQIDLGPRSPWGRFVRRVREADALVLDEIRSRRAAPQRSSDVLSMLLEARDEHGEPMTDAELRDQLVTLLVAGHETTATSLAWALWHVLRTPRVHEALVREVRDAAEGGEVPPGRVQELELLDRVIRETLRLEPVVPMVGRVLQRPMRVGGLDLPAKTPVLCSIYLAHRRAAAYPDPERFDPDRFAGVKASPYEWFPFGGGVRRCIGMAFALFEMKTVLATMLARASLRLPPGARVRRVRRSITVSPSGGMPLVADWVWLRPARRAPAAPAGDAVTPSASPASSRAS